MWFIEVSGFLLHSPRMRMLTDLLVTTHTMLLMLFLMVGVVYRAECMYAARNEITCHTSLGVLPEKGAHTEGSPSSKEVDISQELCPRDRMVISMASLLTPPRTTANPLKRQRQDFEVRFDPYADSYSLYGKVANFSHALESKCMSNESVINEDFAEDTCGEDYAQPDGGEPIIQTLFADAGGLGAGYSPSRSVRAIEVFVTEQIVRWFFPKHPATSEASSHDA